MSPPNGGAHVLLPGTRDCVTLYSQRDFADVIKLKILRWGDNPDLSSWAQCNHKGSYKRGWRGREGDVMKMGER